MDKKYLIFFIFSALTMTVIAQEINFENKIDSINQKRQYIHLEFGSSIDLIAEDDLNILNQNYSKLGSSTLIFNLGFIYKNKIAMGITTMDSKIKGIQRNIHQLYINYNYNINNDLKIYLSQKIPFKNWDELNDNQFKSSRIGFGIKYRIISFDEFDCLIDLNYDQLGFQDGPESKDGTFLIGFSIKINDLKNKFK